MIWRKPERNQRVAIPTGSKPADLPESAIDPVPARVRSSRPSLSVRLHAWHEQHLYGLFSSLGRMSARPWATLFTVLLLGLAIALPLLLYVVLENARNLSGGMREAREIVVFLKPAVAAPGSEALAKELRARPDIAEVTIRTPEQGLDEFRQLSGFSDALAVLQENPLPSVLVVTPKLAAANNTPQAVGNKAADLEIVDSIKADARVDLVQYDAQWRQRLSALLDFGQRAMWALAIVLGLATLLVIVETVRGDIRNHAEEIAVMQLIGADNSFVRRPFLYSGAWYGLLGGLIAVAIVGATELALAAPVARLLASYDNRYAISGLALTAMLLTIAASAALGWIGAWLASSRQLRLGYAGT